MPKSGKTQAAAKKPSEKKKLSKKKESDKIDEAMKESFPASDPPAWTTSHMGKPVRQKKPQK